MFFQRGRENPRHEGATQKSEDNFKYILRTDVGYVKIRKVEEGEKKGDKQLPKSEETAEKIDGGENSLNEY